MKIGTLLLLFAHKCVYCGCRVRIHVGAGAVAGSDATKDHDVPRCRMVKKNDTKFNSQNEVLACARCNSSKSDMTGPEFLSFLRTKKLPQSYIDFIELRLAKRLGI